MIKNNYCSRNLKTSYLILYEVLYVDIEPFLYIHKSENRNSNLHDLFIFW